MQSDLAEAVCAHCLAAFWVEPDFSWGVCPACLHEALERL